MKKLLSLLLAITLLVSFSTSAMAANREARQPDVFVNDTLVEFADQCAYITDEGRTLVPARGVFEAMDCKVDWDAENYVVTVTNESQKKEITLTIDNTEMKVVTDGNETVKTLDVPATLMNNRTMVPLRAISEALGCMVLWNGAEYSVSISYTKQITAEEFSQILQNIFNGSGDKEDKEEEPEEQEPVVEPERAEASIYLKAPDSEVKVGDVISVPVMISDVKGLQGAMFRVKWDPAKLEILGMHEDDNFVFEGYTDKPELFSSLSNINTDNLINGVITVGGATMDSTADYPSGEYCLGILHFRVLEVSSGQTVSLSFDESENKTVANTGAKDILFSVAKGIDIIIK